jgi:uracil phosphoribosyltransferase
MSAQDAKANEELIKTLQAEFKNLHVMPQTRYLRCLQTKVRDADCSRADFVFYSDQLLRLLVEATLDTLPMVDKTITTPTDAKFNGVELARPVCGVSILRAGESMEFALRSVLRGCKVGKILIQRDESLAHKV